MELCDAAADCEFILGTGIAVGGFGYVRPIYGVELP
jgi:hypothetical protein